MSPYKCSDLLTYLLTYRAYDRSCSRGFARTVLQGELLTALLHIIPYVVERELCSSSKNHPYPWYFKKFYPFWLSCIPVWPAPHETLAMPTIAQFMSSAVSGPSVWNDLPPTLHASSTTLGQFQNKLKTTILFGL